MRRVAPIQGGGTDHGCSSDESAVSDAQGLFTFPALPNGKYTVTINYKGFTAWTQTVTLGAGQSSHIAAALKVATNKEDVQVYAGVKRRVRSRQSDVDSRQHHQRAAIRRDHQLAHANVADAMRTCLPSVTLERDEGEGKL